MSDTKLCPYCEQPIIMPELTYKTEALGGHCLDNSKPYISPFATCAVEYDGKFVANCEFEEGGRNNFIVDLDNLQVLDGGAHTAGWGVSGGLCIAVNSKYIFTAGIQDNQGGYLYDTNKSAYPEYVVNSEGKKTNYAWAGFTRKGLSDKNSAPGFEGASGAYGAFKVINKYPVMLDSVPTALDASIRGLACVNNLLYVSNPYMSRILVLDSETLATTNSFSISGTGQLAVSWDKNLWAACGDSVKKVDATTGAVLFKVSTLYPPNMIGVLSDGRLWITNLTDNKILIYNKEGTVLEEILNPTPAGSVVLGFFRKDSNDYVMWKYLNGSYGVVATKFNSNGVKVAEMDSLLFLECPDVSPSDNIFHSRSYTIHQSVDNKPRVPTLLLDEVYSDYRNRWFTVSTYYREFLGGKFLFDFDQQGIFCMIRKIVPYMNHTRTAGLHMGNKSFPIRLWRPKAKYSEIPKDSDWELDTSKSAHINMFPDSNGTIWKTVFRGNEIFLQKIPCSGLDLLGNPVYTFRDIQEEKLNGLLGADIPARFYYDPVRDCAVLCGLSKAGEHGYRILNVFARYDNWSGVNGVRSKRWTVSVPDIMSVSFDGDLLTLGQLKTSSIHCFHFTTGMFLKEIPNTGVTAWLDCNHGHKVRKLLNTNYLVIVMNLIGGSARLHSITLK